MRENPVRETKISHAFVNILAVLSIIGFISIISHTIFGINMTPYMETLWLGILGTGFIIESNPKKLFHSIKNRLEEKNFSSTTTLVIGILAVTAGIFSLPQIAIQNQAFLGLKGIMSIIAITFIIFQTWVIK